jgi:chromosome partitioning protein
VAVITLLNQKGGVGKTSTCHHVSAALAQLGKRVLLIDADPQSSLTQGFWGPAALEELHPSATIAAVLRGEDPFPEQVVHPSGVGGIDLVPGSQQANDANVPRPWETPADVQALLRTFLEGVRGRYDMVLVDCPPTLSFCSWAALVASDAMIVPLQPEDYGAQGVRAIQDSIDLVRCGPNPRLALLGYLITMINGRLAIHKAYETRLRAVYGEDVFATMVPYAADFKEAIASRKSILQYKPKGASARVIKALADEILVRLASRTLNQEEAA